jgi:hypothetical protein
MDDTSACVSYPLCSKCDANKWRQRCAELLQTSTVYCSHASLLETSYSYNAGIKTTWGLSLRHLGRLDLSVGTSKYVCLLAMSHVKCDAHDSKCFSDFMLSIGHALCNIFAHMTRLWAAQAMPTQGTPTVVYACKSCYFLKENSSFSSTTSSSLFCSRILVVG